MRKFEVHWTSFAGTTHETKVKADYFELKGGTLIFFELTEVDRQDFVVDSWASSTWRSFRELDV